MINLKFPLTYIIMQKVEFTTWCIIDRIYWNSCRVTMLKFSLRRFNSVVNGYVVKSRWSNLMPQNVLGQWIWWGGDGDFEWIKCEVLKNSKLKLSMTRTNSKDIGVGEEKAWTLWCDWILYRPKKISPWEGCSEM